MVNWWKNLRGWTKLWITWAFIVVAGFFAIEMPAVFNDEKDDTLTEHIVNYVPPEAVFFPAFGAFVLWFTYHMAVRYARKHREENTRAVRAILKTERGVQKVKRTIRRK